MQGGAEARAGPEQLAALMHAAGASPTAATPAWLGNAYRWVLWKLARWERRLPALAGRLLTVPVVLDQLMHRQALAAALGLSMKP